MKNLGSNDGSAPAARSSIKESQNAMKEMNDQYYAMIQQLKRENLLLKQQKELNVDLVMLAVSQLQTAQLQNQGDQYKLVSIAQGLQKALQAQK